MYRLINRHIEPLLALQEVKRLVHDHDDLMHRFAEADAAKDTEFQRHYASFRESRGVNSNWRANYFKLLEDIRLKGSEPDLRQICQQTQDVRRGAPSLEFSFATRLFHMVNPQRPIYDRLVTQYARVWEKSLLRDSITRFRNELPPDTSFTVEKIIDSLIWAFVKWAGPTFLAGKLHHE